MINRGLLAVLIGLLAVVLIPVILLGAVVAYAFWPFVLTAVMIAFVCWAVVPFREGWKKGKQKRLQRSSRS